jgi:Sulfotransferase family
MARARTNSLRMPGAPTICSALDIGPELMRMRSEVDTVTATPIISPELALRGPNVIGATGGSGTRALAKVLRESGMYTGSDLNAYEDALPFGAFSDRWINRFVASNGGDQGLADAMGHDLDGVLAGHVADMPPSARSWGWKEPRSIYLVSFFDGAMPSLRFLHFIRDGRDMAFSENQQQLRKHGRAVIGNVDPLRRWARSIRLWARINTEAADYCERALGDRYLRVRFEDLCAEPHRTIEQVFDFFGIDGDAAAASTVVRPPSTLGRWKAKRPRTIDRLNELAGPALERFGYA